jgi:hypothetical protein
MPYPPAAPVNSGTCVVYGTLLLATGAVAPGVEVTFEVVARHGLTVTGGKVVAQESVVTATTDSTGFFEAELIRSANLAAVVGETPDDGIPYLCVIEAANLRAQITVPSANSVDFQTLL